jgi:hypothetical protein
MADMAAFQASKVGGMASEGDLGLVAWFFAHAAKQDDQPLKRPDRSLSPSPIPMMIVREMVLIGAQYAFEGI